MRTRIDGADNGSVLLLGWSATPANEQATARLWLNGYSQP
jgi:hypothetical protein